MEQAESKKVFIFAQQIIRDWTKIIKTRIKLENGISRK